jgi:mRNA-degrading endonuclease RelE of RelBE toxin-antitoxin system
MKLLNVYLSPAVLKEIDQLPGHVRQRVRRSILELRTNPFPAAGKPLETNAAKRRDVWRIRIDQILVMAVRQRPPYQYEDLDTLLSNLGLLDS